MKCVYLLLVLFIVEFAYAQNVETFAPKNNLNTNFMKLNITNTWKSTTAKLVVPDSSGSPSTKSKIEEAKIKYVQYRDRFPLAAIFDPNTKNNCIVSGNQTFYISDKSGMIGCLLVGGELICRKSYFEMPSSASDINATIKQFTTIFDEKDLMKQESNMFRIFLNVAAPFPFFTANSLGGSQPGTPTIKAINVADNILQLDLLSNGNKFNGSFWINLKNKKIVKSVVDGQDMDIKSEKPWAIPKN